jgi:hypothetical protein
MLVEHYSSDYGPPCSRLKDSSRIQPLEVHLSDSSYTTDRVIWVNITHPENILFPDHPLGYTARQEDVVKPSPSCFVYVMETEKGLPYPHLLIVRKPHRIERLI